MERERERERENGRKWKWKFSGARIKYNIDFSETCEANY